MDEKVMGCLGTGEQTTDYRLCSGDSDLLPPLVKKDEIRFSYNQYKNKRSRTSCTIFAAVGMMSDLWNYEFTYDEIKEIDDMSYERGRIKGEGWWVQSAVKLVADRWNEKYPDKQVAYYRVNKYDDDIMENCLDKLYALDGNQHLNDEYYKDREDGMIDGTDFGYLTNGHSICITKKDGQRSVKDSGSIPYYGLKNKVSKITNFGSNFYIYVPVGDNLQEVKRLNKIKAKIVNGMELNSELWHLSNSELHKDKLHDMNNFYRDWLGYIDGELKGLV